MRNGLFGKRPVGEVTLVEAPVSQFYARRARLALISVSVVAGAAAASVSSVFVSPWWAIALGVLAGGVCGLMAGVLVAVWPVLRVLWWWSFEITAGVLLLGGSSLLARVTNPWLALTVVLL